MPNQLAMAGSPGKPLKFVPIYTSRFFQGLWTQRNPLRSGALGWQTEKYYGANNDCLIDGLNTEVSNRLTLIRRPGTSVYNNQDFPPVYSFYSFRLFSTTDESIKVITDTISIIYDGTGPNTKQIIYTKNFPVPARFQSVGNVLYFGDGDVTKKWIQSLNEWTPSSSFSINDFFIDDNQNIQVFADLATFRETSFFTVASTSATGSLLKVRYYSAGRGGNAVGIPGSVMSLNALLVHSELNGQGVVGPLVSDVAVTPYQRVYTETGSQTVTDNVLTVVVQFSGTFPVGDPTFLFPVGSRVSFTGTKDSPFGGGGIILTSSVDVGLLTCTFTVTYRHPDYGAIPSPGLIQNIVSYYGDRELTITVSVGPWSDEPDTGFASVGSSGSSLTNIASVSIGSAVMTVLSSGTFGAVLLPHTKVTFSGFTGATAFLNGKSGFVLTCNPTTLLVIFEWTNFPTTVTATGAIDAVDTAKTPTTLTSLTIASGLLDVLAANDFHVGDVVKFAGMVTATELNGLQFPVSFSNGSSFHCHVPFADRGVTPEGAATAQEGYGFLVLENGTITLYQGFDVSHPNPFSPGQTVVFSGFTISAFLNGKSFTVDNTWDRRHYRGAYPDGTATITQVSIAANIATVTAKNQYTAGQYVTLVTNYPGFPTFAKILSTTSVNFTIDFVHAADAGTPTVGNSYLFYTTMTDVGGKISTVPGSAGIGTTGLVTPPFDNLAGASTFEEGIEWANRGSNLQNMGLAGPEQAPDVALLPPAALPPPVNVWVANAYFAQAGAGPITVVDNTAGPYIQEVTQAGTTGAVQPAWNTTVGGTTSDGSVVWTNKGLVGRVQNQAYQLGDRVAVTYYVQVITGYEGYAGPGSGYSGYSGDTRYGDTYSPGGVTPGSPIYTTIGPFSSYFTCATAGTTLDAPSSSVQWSNAPGQFVTDGSVTWQNTGTLQLWPGALADLSQSGDGSIVDSNNNIQNVVTSGVTGATEPTWSTDQGVTTMDGTVVWVNAGPSGGGASVTPDTVPGKWYYGYAFKNSFTNEVSNMSPFSLPVVPVPGAAVSISGVDSDDPQYDTIVIYRTLQGGSTFFWIAEISALSVVGGRWNYLDVSPDPPAPGATMNLLIPAAVNLENTPPPTGTTNWTFHLNRLWGSVGNVVVFSNPPGFSIGSNYTQFPPINFFTFSSKVNRLWPIGTAGILVFTATDIFIITGTTTATFSPAPFLKGVGLLNYSALSVMGSIICMFTADGQLITLDPNSGVTEVGFPIGNLINTGFDPRTTFVSWHVAGSQDKALYLADGSTGWHRLSPTAAPESGLMWSPFAAIVGGTSAVQSVEVSTGVFRLLIGS